MSVSNSPSDEPTSPSKRSTAGRWLVFGLSLGVGVGAAMGSATHNMGYWVATGAVGGALFGVLVDIAKSDRA